MSQQRFVSVGSFTAPESLPVSQPNRQASEPNLRLSMMQVCILTATTSGEQRTFRLSEGEVATLGRSSTCAFQVDDAKVSRQHCLLGFRGRSLEVTDLGSANEIKHRGVRKSRFTLQPGDGFHAGKTYVAFVGIESDGVMGDAGIVAEQPARSGAAADLPWADEFPESPRVSDENDVPQETLACVPRRQEPHESEPPIGSVLGNYRLMSVLGRSDRCTAFLAEHVQLHRRVAIKWLRKDEAGEAAATVFLADMRKAAAVSAPGLLSVYDIEPDGGCCYAAMELASGRSLAACIVDGPRLSFDEAVAAVADVLRALAMLHSMQCIHGGIKPENIFLMERGGAKLGDVRAEARLRPMEWAACAAPEYRQQGISSVRSDLYSVGAVAFAAITGGLSLRDGKGGQLDAAEVLGRDDSIPKALVEWIRAMVAEDPSERPDSAKAALDSLIQAAGKAALEREPIAVAVPAKPDSHRVAPLPVLTARPATARANAPRREPMSPAKAFFARLTGEMIVFLIILVAGIALLLLLKIKWPDFDIYRLIERSKPQ